jgi:predicted aminopeptidase
VRIRHRIVVATAIAVQLQLAGCYYLQAAQGQLDVLARRDPIPELLADPSTPAGLAERLRLVQDARDFSIAELGMPDNGSYRSYADVEREYVLWSIFATPELSLDPVNWCYPIVGCVSYRGFFRYEAAQREAQRFLERGFDVYVGGIPAYSTLGRFDDPVLNTMLGWDELQLVSTVFHELAHQVLYIPDDTGFNESFASAVEEFSVERFLTARGADLAIAEYRQRLRLRQELAELITAARDDLGVYFAETLDDDEKRLLKEDRFGQLLGDIRDLFESHDADVTLLLQEPWNNARLLTFNLYEGYLPAFRQLYQQCERDLECFYNAANEAAELERDARELYLEELATRWSVSTGCISTKRSLRREVPPVNRQ